MLRYLDTSCVIDATRPRSLRHLSARATLALHSRSEFCVSDLVRLESIVEPLRSNDQVRLALLRSFFASVTRLDLPSVVFDDAARLRADHGLKTPDALHLATALHHGCGEFWTNDAKLARTPVALTFRSF